jgi:hypothetical protein
MYAVIKSSSHVRIIIYVNGIFGAPLDTIGMISNIIIINSGGVLLLLLVRVRFCDDDIENAFFLVNSCKSALTSTRMVEGLIK